MTEQDRVQLELLRAEMNGKLSEINVKLDGIRDGVKDHELRIRSVERWKLSIPISVLLAIATVIGAAIGGVGR